MSKIRNSFWHTGISCCGTNVPIVPTMVTTYCNMIFASKRSSEPNSSRGNVSTIFPKSHHFSSWDHCDNLFCYFTFKDSWQTEINTF